MLINSFAIARIGREARACNHQTTNTRSHNSAPSKHTILLRLTTTKPSERGMSSTSVQKCFLPATLASDSILDDMIPICERWCLGYGNNCPPLWTCTTIHYDNTLLEDGEDVAVTQEICEHLGYCGPEYWIGRKFRNGLS